MNNQRVYERAYVQVTDKPICEGSVLRNGVWETIVRVERDAEPRQVWCGIFKLIEEMGELHQVLGKLGPFPDGAHPDGGPLLYERLEQEIGDVVAACIYFGEVNGLSKNNVTSRTAEKLAKYKRWGLTGVMPEPEQQ